LNQIAGAL